MKRARANGFEISIWNFSSSWALKQTRNCSAQNSRTGSGALKQTWLASLADDLLRVRQRGSEIIAVTSGAIALGRRMLKLSGGSLKLEESQAAAAVGQIALAQAWRAA